MNIIRKILFVMKKICMLLFTAALLYSCGSFNQKNSNKPGGRENPVQNNNNRDRNNGTRESSSRSVNKSDSNNSGNRKSNTNQRNNSNNR